MKRFIAAAVTILALVVFGATQMQAETVLMPMGKAQFFGLTGTALANGKVYFCQPAGTCPGNPKSTYTDWTGNTANTNPVILDSAGRANIWLEKAGYYKVRVTTSAGTLIYEQDYVSAAGGGDTTITTGGEWETQPNVVTYVTGSTYSVTGDYTSTFQPGRRSKQVVSAGTVYGTIWKATYATGTTTVDLYMDGTQALDSGLSAVALSSNTQDIPSYINAKRSLTTVTVSMTLNQSHAIVQVNSSGTTTLTLPTASTVASVTLPKEYEVRSIGTGTVILGGTIDGTANPNFVGNKTAAKFMTDGTTWWWTMRPTRVDAAPAYEDEANTFTHTSGQTIQGSTAAAATTPRLNLDDTNTAGRNISIGQHVKNTFRAHTNILPDLSAQESTAEPSWIMDVHDGASDQFRLRRNPGGGSYSNLWIINNTGTLTTGNPLYDGTNTIKVKIIDIGDWNMDLTQTVTIAHGLTFANIRNISAMIRNDANSDYLMATPSYPGGYEFTVNIEETTSTIVTLTRKVGGICDGVLYDATSYNRGWITIWYVL